MEKNELKKTTLQFVVVGVLFTIAYSAAAQQNDSLAEDLFIRYDEPHYLMEERARLKGAHKARVDDSLGQLVLYKYYDTIDSLMVRFTQHVVWQKYQLKFVALLETDPTPPHGYMDEADRIMRQRHGDDYWHKIEQGVYIFSRTRCW